MIAIPDHTLGESTHLQFFEVEDGPVIYDRYVSTADWQDDPEKIIADVSEHLEQRAAIEEANKPVPIEKPTPVVMTKEQIATKITAIAEAKAAEAAAKVEATAEPAQEVLAQEVQVEQ